MADGGSIWVKLRLDSKGFIQGMDKAKGRTQSFAGGLGKLGPLMAGAFSAVAVIKLGKELVNLQAEYSKTMSRVSALTSATMANQKALSLQAQQLGAETQFTATQAAEAMGFLAQAGLDVNEIYSAMPNTLELAATGQIDLARAADISTNIMSAYALQAEDLGRVNDIIANTTTNANTNVEEFAEAFKMVGPIAKSANQKIEDVAAQIGLLANAGIKGTMAGTALRTMMAKLVNPTGDALDILERFNITTLDMQGNLRPLNDILLEMKQKGVGLKDMFEVFDLRAAGSADVLKGLSGDFESFVEVVGRSGTAARVAAEQMNNLGGDILELKSAWQGMLLSAGQELDPLMRAVTQMGTGLLRWIAPQQKLSTALMETQIQMNAEVNALKSANITGEARATLVERINRQYKDYLPNLVDEETSIADINKLQEKANELFLEKITIRAQEEILQESMKEATEIQKNLLEEQIALEELRNEKVSKYAATMVGMQTPAEAQATAIAMQAEKVSYLSEQYGEATEKMLKLKDAFKGFALDPDTPDPEPEGGGGGGGNQLTRTADEAKAVGDAMKYATEETKAYLNTTTKETEDFVDAFVIETDFLTGRHPYQNMIDEAILATDAVGVLAEAMEEARLKQDALMEEMIEKKEAVMEGWLGLASIVQQTANAIANAKGNWAALAAAAISGVAKMVPQIQKAIEATKSLAVVKQSEGVAAAAASGAAMPFPANLIAIGTSVAALLATVAPFVGSFESGIDNVPYDGLAMIHKGEAVIPASENKRGRGGVLTSRIELRELVIALEEERGNLDRV